jgi:hypothetical protein
MSEEIYQPLRLKDLAVGERPQERLEKLGPAALSDAELLAMLLRSGSGGYNVLVVAQRLIAEAGSFAALVQWSETDFRRLKGIEVIPILSDAVVGVTVLTHVRGKRTVDELNISWVRKAPEVVGAVTGSFRHSRPPPQGQTSAASRITRRQNRPKLCQVPSQAAVCLRSRTASVPPPTWDNPVLSINRRPAGGRPAGARLPQFPGIGGAVDLALGGSEAD